MIVGPVCSGRREPLHLDLDAAFDLDLCGSAQLLEPPLERVVRFTVTLAVSCVRRIVLQIPSHTYLLCFDVGLRG